MHAVSSLSAAEFDVLWFLSHSPVPLHLLYVMQIPMKCPRKECSATFFLVMCRFTMERLCVPVVSNLEIILFKQ